MLLGGNGRDLLIGGAGADKLVGQAGDDILIAGKTDYGALDQALSDIMAAWNSAGTYATRVAQVSAFLNVSTVHDDGEQDMLTGAADADLFYGNLVDGVLDMINDKLPGESAIDEK